MTCVSAGSAINSIPKRPNQLTGTVLEVNLTLVAVFKVVRQPYMRDLSKVQDLTYAPFFAATEVSGCGESFAASRPRLAPKY